MKKLIQASLAAIAVNFIMIGCANRPDNAVEVNQQPAIYPDYIGVTIPVGIAPLNFNLKDNNCNKIYVEVTGSKGGELSCSGEYADFDIDEWHDLLKKNKGGKLNVSVMGKYDGEWKKFRDFQIMVSNYSLDEWGMTYRLIAPSYEIYGRMGIYERNLSNFDEKELMGNSMVANMCINCHTANRTNPDDYTLHVRGEKGATLIHKNGKDEWLKAKNDQLGGSMVYPYWHPGGRYIAYSTNQTGQMFHRESRKRIDVYDKASDILVYDTKTHTILQDSLLKSSNWAENVPVFSPDGKYMYYITAYQELENQDHYKDHYNLCRIAFDEKTGTFGTQVDTLFNANAIGKSITWPRPSYDGKYLMFTMLDYGYFSVWHNESDLWLMDLNTGKSRILKEVNSNMMESLHNWNVNSHWFFFTSRRDDGLYSRIYLSSLDDNGKATKPFMLPQRNPKEYYQRLMYSYNTPDFTSKPVEADHREFQKAIESGERVETQYKRTDRK